MIESAIVLFLARTSYHFYSVTTLTTAVSSHRINGLTPTKGRVAQKTSVGTRLYELASGSAACLFLFAKIRHSEGECKIRERVWKYLFVFI